jgi:acetoin utilization deacetylase AcuC-like enzyme
MPLLVVSSERFAHHLTPAGHPERVERAQVLEGVALGWRDRGGAVAAPRAATDDELRAVHAPDHVRAIAETAGRAVRLDADTFTSPDSCDVAALAAGAVLTGVDHTLAGHGPALALVRPPGHHAERDRAMGFCLFNNVAVGAAYARANGLARVAIVDFDVHHGNGTQWIFYTDPDVLYVSTHQFPYYPGTGSATEVGHGRGAGATVNLPLEAGATDADYDLVFRSGVEPVLAEFGPDLILVSAGFDVHARDPLAQMRVSTAGCRRMAASLWRSAGELCAGRLVAVTEGGYDLQALGECLDATVDVLAGPAVAADPAPEVLHGGATPRGERALEALRTAQKGFWRRL